MVSKCANPGCSTPFRYLHEGKLFRLQTEAAPAGGPTFGADPDVKKPPRHIEFFWLCDHCAGSMTLIFDRNVGLMVKPLTRTQTAA
jgi:hypothetical protein